MVLTVFDKRYDAQTLLGRFQQHPLTQYCNKIIGWYYIIVHFLVGAVCAVILLFSTNKIHLMILAVIIVLDAFCIICMKQCPLSLLESKYLRHNVALDIKYWLKALPIKYECNHAYECQLEFVINMWLLVVFKLFVLMIYGDLPFHIQPA